MEEENGKKYRGTFTPSILCTNRIDIKNGSPSQCLTSRTHMPMISDKIEWGKFRVQTKDIIEISQFHRFIISKPQDKTEQIDQSGHNIGQKIYLPRIKTETYEEKWKLKKNPKLILWLVTALGETVEEQNKLHPDIQKMRHFCRDLIDAVDVSDSWLIVNGNDQELFNYVGNAVDIHSISTKDQPAVIGMTRWPYDKDAYCDVHEETKQDDKEFREYTIDCKHSRGKKGIVNPYIKYHMFYDSLTSESSNEKREGLFECVILLRGDKFTLEIIKHLCEKDIAIILVKGFGGEVDELIKELESPEETPKEESNIPDTPKENLKTSETWQSTKIDRAILETLKKHTKYEILDFTSDKRDSLKRSILSALLMTSKQTKNVNLLKLCIEFNQYEVFKIYDSNIIPNFNLEKEQWLTQILPYAVTLKRQKFIEHFIDNGSNFTLVFSLSALNKLYTDTQWSAREKIKDLTEVSPRLREYLGEFFSFKRYRKEDISNYKNKQDKDVFPNEPNKNALRDLFVWSLLADEIELSKVFWKNVDHPIIAALFAFGIFREKLKRDPSNSVNKYSDAKNFYETCATKLISESYSKDKELTFKILLQKIPKWGNTSCIELAMETYNKTFLSEKACIKVQHKIWKNSVNFINQMHFQKTINDDNVETENEKNRKCQSCNKTVTPEVLFYLDLFGFLAFLVIYAYLLVIELQQKSFHWLEWVVWAWIITFCLDGFHKVSYTTKRRVKNIKQSTEKKETFWEIFWLYIKTFFKIYIMAHKNLFEALHFLAFFSFIVAWSLRCSAYYNTGDVTARMEAALVFFSIDYVFFCLILFKFFYLSKFLGPMLLMISKMFLTLLKYLVILLVFFIAFAIASETVLYPHSPISGGLIFNMLRRSYWSAFGNYFLEEMESTVSKDDNACTNDSALYSDYTHLRCPSTVGRYYVPVLMGIYVMIINILLFNLIIAKFNSTIFDIENDAEKVWHYQLFSLTAEYSKRLVMQPPFFPLTFIMYTCMRRKNTNLFVIEFKPAVANCLKRLEQVVMDDYLRPTQKENNQRCYEPENNETVTKFSLATSILSALEKNPKVQSGDEYRSGEDQGNNANENSGESKSISGFFADLVNTESEQNKKDDGVRNAIRRLKRNLKAVGRKIIHLQPDGNCIFRAAVASLKDKITPEELRYQVYLHIRKYESHYGEFLTDKSIVEKIKEDGHWNSEAGDLIPYAISNVLGRSLTIVTNNVGNICIPVSKGDCLNDKPIFLAYLSYPGSEHYCATKR